MTINLIQILLIFLVFFALAYGARLLLRAFAAPAPAEAIVMLILLVMFIIVLINSLGISGPVIRIGEAPGIVQLASG